MTRKRFFIPLFSAMLIFTTACAPETGVDRRKFAELDRTVQELKAAISTDRPCDLPDHLQQRLEEGVAAVRDKAVTQDERNLVAACTHLLATYRDGLLLCRSRNQLSHFGFFPKGRIYVFQEIDPLVKKYELPVEKHLYKPTGQYMRTIDGGAILVIWERARAQIKDIETMLKYN